MGVNAVGSGLDIARRFNMHSHWLKTDKMLAYFVIWIKLNINKKWCEKSIKAV